MSRCPLGPVDAAEPIRQFPYVVVVSPSTPGDLWDCVATKYGGSEAINLLIEKTRRLAHGFCNPSSTTDSASCSSPTATDHAPTEDTRNVLSGAGMVKLFSANGCLWQQPLKLEEIHGR
jgi:hypothetical protein